MRLKINLPVRFRILTNARLIPQTYSGVVSDIIRFPVPILMVFIP